MDLSQRMQFCQLLLLQVNFFHFWFDGRTTQMSRFVIFVRIGVLFKGVLSLWVSSKLVSAVFHFQLNDRSLIIMKNPFSRSSFSRYSDFCIPSFLLFSPLDQRFRGWLKKNNIFCLISSKWKRYDIETLSIDRVINKEQLYRKILKKICTKS